MMQKYDIFKRTTDNVFVWIDTVENITDGKKRLTSLASTRPGDYHLWDISRHEFVEGNTCLLLDKAIIVQTAKAALMRHVWDTFVDEPPSVAEGGTGVVVAGCPRCRKHLSTNAEYLRHLADDVLPRILDLVLAPAKTD
jgi:hypothetical protein